MADQQDEPMETDESPDDSPPVGPSSAGLDVIAESLAKLKAQLIKIKEERRPPVTKVLTNLSKLHEEVVLESMNTPTGKLSVAAHVLIEQNMEKSQDALKALAQEHRATHTLVSRVGKDVDRYMGKHLTGLLKNQKNLEKETELRKLTCDLISRHLVASGLVRTAERLCQEVPLSKASEDHMTKRLDVDTVIGKLREGDLDYVLGWQETNDPDNHRLRSDLDKMKLLTFLQDGSAIRGKRLEAIQYCRKRKLTEEESDDDFAQLMGAIFSPPGVERYKRAFTASMWNQQQKKVIDALASNSCILNSLLSVGVRAVPSLMNMKIALHAREDFLFSGDELPIEIPIARHVHSTLSCPILRQQATKDNPAMRLSCGHVISRDAMNKLSQASRVNRLKCPYCPVESSTQEAKEVKF